MERERIELKLPSRMCYVSPVLAFIRQVATQIGFHQRRIEDIQLIVDEMSANAIEHGSENATSGIDLIVHPAIDQLEIIIRDKGKKSTQERLTTERLHEISQERVPGEERGHGLFIAKKLSDDLHIEPNSVGGNDVRVVFRLEP
jgi:anti-sigma regulatory factor (Ser/Thr protein kinase)